MKKKRLTLEYWYSTTNKAELQYFIGGSERGDYAIGFNKKTIPVSLRRRILAMIKKELNLR